MACDEQYDQDKSSAIVIVIVVLCNCKMQMFPLYMGTVSDIAFWSDARVTEESWSCETDM
jgi:hypothetical protein